MRQSQASARSRYTVSGFTAEGIVTYIVIPPDGGWGWLVVIVAFFANFLADGSVTTFSLFKDDIQETFKSSEPQTMLASSLMTATTFLAGPFVCAMANKFGFRIVSIVGGTLACCGYVLAAYSFSIEMFVTCYGIVIGVGFSMTYISSILVVGFYFERWRALATGCAVSGSAIGTTLFPYIFEEVCSALTWQTKFLILACGCGCIIVLSLIYKPVMPTRVLSPLEEGKVMQSMDSASNDGQSLFVRYHNLAFPTNAEIHDKNPTATMTVMDTTISTMSFRSRKYSMGTDRSMAIIMDIRDDLNFCQKCCIMCTLRCSPCCIKDDYVPTRPMYRDDVLYQGSVMRLPEYHAAQKERLKFNLNVTRVTTMDDVEESYIPCLICPHSVKRTLATMLDFGLFKSAPFVFLILSSVFTAMGYYVPFPYIPSLLVENKLPKHVATTSLMVLGIGNVFGRLLSGVLAVIPKVKPVPVSVAGVLIAGTAIIIIPFSHNEYFQFGCAATFGFTVAVTSTLKSVILVDILGLSKLSNSFGIFMLASGIAIFSGNNLVAYMHSVTRNSLYCLEFSGTALTLSALLLIPIPKLIQWEKKRDERRLARARAQQAQQQAQRPGASRR